MTKRALITGASSGIGAAFAPLLASRGYDLILVARRLKKLESLRDQVLKEHGVTVEVISQDLSKVGAAEELMGQFEGEVTALINNAGYGKAGEAVKVDVDAQLGIIDLNVRALTDLSLRFAKKMVAQKHGRILNVASVVSFVPVPYLSVYSASKAYVLSFSEALDYELRGHGVRVQALCPGSTQSEFFNVALDTPTDQAPQKSRSFVMSAEAVARQGVNMLESSKTTHVTGLFNKLVAQLPRTMPRFLVPYITGSFTPAKPE